MLYGKKKKTEVKLTNGKDQLVKVLFKVNKYNRKKTKLTRYKTREEKKDIKWLFKLYFWTKRFEISIEEEEDKQKYCNCEQSKTN